MHADRLLRAVYFEMGVETWDVVDARLVRDGKVRIFEQNTEELAVSWWPFPEELYELTHFQKGKPSEEPTTLVGMPSASLITERS